MEQTKFQEEEIPFHILSRFGLTREMLEDLPQSAYMKLRNGMATPVLPIKVELDNGDIALSRSRVRLVRKADGMTNVVFHPKLMYANLSMFTPGQQKALYAGEVIIAEADSGSGSATPAYYQLDPDTAQVISVPVAIVGANLKVLEDSLHLTEAEATGLKKGESLTLAKDKEMITFGIDLTAVDGFRYIEGDEKDWRNADKRDWGKYNFGLNGCWTMDGDGNIDYVNENDYTDEMWSEMKKRAGQQRGVSTFKM